jgi:alkylated DNA repair dioxygenase AlkB
MALAAGLDLRRPLAETAERGYAHVSRAVDASYLRALWRELESGPFQRFEGSFGLVRQEIEGYDVLDPMEGYPLVAELRDELAGLLLRQGRGTRGLATWWPNEAGIARYRPGSIGITPHLDGKWYRRLVIVATVYGRAPFAISGSRDPDDVVDRWVAGPGDVVLMRGPGLAGHPDGRPFHLVEGPRRGERLSLGIRMSQRPRGR